MNTGNRKNTLQLVECPRDAMQGWKTHIPAEKKTEYINSLLRVGFHTIDFGSFVSPKAIPQMADTKQVLDGLDLRGTNSKLLAIVANQRGAEEALAYPAISYLGFPFSVSQTFQIRNTNSTMEESLSRVEQIQQACLKNGRELVVYLSMGFGNPYGDAYNEDILIKWAEKIISLDVKTISLADTVGIATPEQISFALQTLIPRFPDIVIGVHLHSSPVNFAEKLEAAYSAGCRRFDGALKGIGGCPMAQDDLVGNMNSELVVDWMEKQQIHTGIDHAELERSLALAAKIFS